MINCLLRTSIVIITNYFIKERTHFNCPVNELLRLFNFFFKYIQRKLQFVEHLILVITTKRSNWLL